MSPKVKRADPPYPQIVEHLRRQIQTGKLHEGDLVPSARQLAARGATEQDAADLGVSAGSPVACGGNWRYDANGDVIEYGERVSIPGRWSSRHYEITPEGAS